MSHISFVGLNTPVLPRSQRIAEATWERYKGDIIREFQCGGSTGNATALRWIKSQNIAGFDPRLVFTLLETVKELPT